MTNRPLVVVGASGFGREVVGLVNDINQRKQTWDLLGLVDDNLSGKTIEGFKILGTLSELNNIQPKPYVAIAIADPRIRKSIVERLSEQGFEFATLIHPTVSMSEFVSIGAGTIVCQNSLFTTNVHIGNHCIINVNCSFGHDTQVKDFTSIMSHSAIAGDVFIGAGCYFGLNCTVINKITIGAWSTYGAGSVVVEDMPEKIVAVGVPSKVIRHFE